MTGLLIGLPRALSQAAFYVSETVTILLGLVFYLKKKAAIVFDIGADELPGFRIGRRRHPAFSKNQKPCRSAAPNSKKTCIGIGAVLRRVHADIRIRHSVFTPDSGSLLRLSS